MKSELKKYIKFILQNHLDAVIYAYIEFLKNNKECDIRETIHLGLEYSNYYKKHVVRYLISILNNKTNEEIQRRIELWKNSELSTSQKFYPVFPQDLFKSYSKLNKAIFYYTYKYTNDSKKKHHISEEISNLDDLIDKIILCGYREIILDKNKTWHQKII